MAHVGAFQVKIHLSELFDWVEAGEEVVIARHGRSVARLVPVADAKQRRAGEAVTRLRELRRGATVGGIDWRELRDAGRR